MPNDRNLKSASLAQQGKIDESNPKNINVSNAIIAGYDIRDLASQGYKLNLDSKSVTEQKFKSFYTDENGKYNKKAFENEYSSLLGTVDYLNGINWKKHSSSWYSFIAESMNWENPTLESVRATTSYVRPTRYFQPTFKSEQTSQPFLIQSAERVAYDRNYFEDWNADTGKWEKKGFTFWNRVSGKKGGTYLAWDIDPITQEYAPVYKRSEYNEGAGRDYLSIWGPSDYFQDNWVGRFLGGLLSSVPGAVKSVVDVMRVLKSDLPGEDVLLSSQFNGRIEFSKEETQKLREGKEVVKEFNNMGKKQYMPFNIVEDGRFLREDDNGNFYYDEVRNISDRSWDVLSNFWGSLEYKGESSYKELGFRKSMDRAGNIGDGVGQVLQVILGGGIISSAGRATIKTIGLSGGKMITKNPGVFAKLGSKVGIIPKSSKLLKIKTMPYQKAILEQYGKHTMTYGMIHGTTIAEGAIYEEARSAGLTMDETFKMMAMTAPAVTLTERLLGTSRYIAKFMPAEIMTKNMIKGNARVIYKLSEKIFYGASKKAAVNKGLIRKMRQGMFDTTYAFKNMQKTLVGGKAVNALRGAIEEPIQENLEDIYYDIAEYVHNKTLAADGTRPGAGQYNLREYGSEEFWEEVKETAIVSSVSGLIGGSIGGTKSNKDITVDAIVDYLTKDGYNNIDANMEELMKVIRQLHKEGALGRMDKDFNNQMITNEGGSVSIVADPSIPENADKTELTNQNDINLQLMLQQVQTIGESIKSSGLMTNELLEKYYGKEGMIRDYWNSYVALLKVKEDVAAIEEKLKSGTITAEEKTKLEQELNDKKNGNSVKINELIEANDIKNGEVSQSKIQEWREEGKSEAEILSNIRKTLDEIRTLKADSKHENSIVGLQEEVNSYLEIKQGQKIANKYRESMQKDVFQTRISEDLLKIIPYEEMQEFLHDVNNYRKGYKNDIQQIREKKRQKNKIETSEKLKKRFNKEDNFDSIVKNLTEEIENEERTRTSEDILNDVIDLVDIVLGEKGKSGLLNTNINEEDKLYITSLTNLSELLVNKLNDPDSPVTISERTPNVAELSKDLQDINQSYTVAEDIDSIKEALGVNMLSFLDESFNPELFGQDKLLELADTILQNIESILMSTDTLRSIKGEEKDINDTISMDVESYDALFDEYNNDTLDDNGNIVETGAMLNPETEKALKTLKEDYREKLEDFKKKYDQVNDQREEKEYKRTYISNFNNADKLDLMLDGLTDMFKVINKGNFNRFVESKDALIEKMKTVEVDGVNLYDKYFNPDSELVVNFKAALAEFGQLLKAVNKENGSYKDANLVDKFKELKKLQTEIEHGVFHMVNNLGTADIEYGGKKETVDLRVVFFHVFKKSLDTEFKGIENLNTRGSLFEDGNTNIYSVENDSIISFADVLHSERITTAEHENALEQAIKDENYTEAEKLKRKRRKARYQNTSIPEGNVSEEFLRYVDMEAENYMNTIMNLDSIEYLEFKEDLATSIKTGEIDQSNPRALKHIWTADQDIAIASAIAFVHSQGKWIGRFPNPNNIDMREDLNIDFTYQRVIPHSGHSVDATYGYLFSNANFNGEKQFQDTLSKRLLIAGEGGSGKTYMVAPVLMQWLSQKGETTKVISSAPGKVSESLRETLEVNNPEAIDIEAIKHQDLFDEKEFNRIKKIAEETEGTFVIMLDEAAKLTEEQIDRFGAMPSNVVIIGFGDPTQSSYFQKGKEEQLRFPNSNRVQFSYGAAISPYITTKHRSNNIDQFNIIEKLSYVARKLKSNASLNNEMKEGSLSGMSYTVTKEGKEGVEFMENVESVIQNFLDTAKSNPSSVIIFETREDAEAFKDKLEKEGNGALKERVKYVLTDRTGNEINSEDDNSVQGQSYDRIYVAIGYNEDVPKSMVRQEYLTYQLKNLITAIGRLETNEEGRGYIAIPKILGHGSSTEVQSLEQIPVARVDEEVQKRDINTKYNFIDGINPKNLNGVVTTKISKETSTKTSKKGSSQDGQGKQGGKDNDGSIERYDIVTYKGRGEKQEGYYYVVSLVGGGSRVKIADFKTGSKTRTVKVSSVKKHTSASETEGGTVIYGKRISKNTALLYANNHNFVIDENGNLKEVSRSSLQKENLMNIIKFYEVIKNGEKQLEIKKGVTSQGEIILYAEFDGKVLFTLSGRDAKLGHIVPGTLTLIEKAKDSKYKSGEVIGSVRISREDFDLADPKDENRSPLLDRWNVYNKEDKKEVSSLNDELQEINKELQKSGSNIRLRLKKGANRGIKITPVMDGTKVLNRYVEVEVREKRKTISSYKLYVNNSMTDDTAAKILKELQVIRELGIPDMETFFSDFNAKSLAFADFFKQNKKQFLELRKTDPDVAEVIKEPKGKYKQELDWKLPDNPTEEQISNYIDKLIKIFNKYQSQMFAPVTMFNGEFAIDNKSRVFLDRNLVGRNFTGEVSTEMPGNIDPPKKRKKKKKKVNRAKPADPFLLNEEHLRLKLPGERIRRLEKSEVNTLLEKLLGQAGASALNLEFRGKVNDVAGFVKGLDMMLTYSPDGKTIEEYKVKHEAMHVILSSLDNATVKDLLTAAESLMTIEERTYYSKKANGTVEYICDSFMNKTNFEKQHKKVYRGFKGLLYNFVDFLRKVFLGRSSAQIIDDFMIDVWNGKHHLNNPKALENNQEINYLDFTSEQLEKLDIDPSLNEGITEKQKLNNLDLSRAFQNHHELKRAKEITSRVILSKSFYSNDLFNNKSLKEASQEFYQELINRKYGTRLKMFDKLISDPNGEYLFNILVNESMSDIDVKKDGKIDSIEKAFKDSSSINPITFTKSQILDVALSGITLKTYQLNENGEIELKNDTQERIDTRVLMDFIIKTINKQNSFDRVKGPKELMDLLKKEIDKQLKEKPSIVENEITDLTFNTVTSFLDMFSPTSIKEVKELINNNETVFSYGDIAYNIKTLLESFPNEKNEILSKAKYVEKLLNHFYVYTNIANRTYVKSVLSPKGSSRTKIVGSDITNGKLSNIKGKIRGSVLKNGGVITATAYKNYSHYNNYVGINIITRDNGEITLTVEGENDVIIIDKEGNAKFKEGLERGHKVIIVKNISKVLGLDINDYTIISLLESNYSIKRKNGTKEVNESSFIKALSLMLIANEKLISDNLSDSKYLKGETSDYESRKTSINERYKLVEKYKEEMDLNLAKDVLAEENETQSDEDSLEPPIINASSFYDDLRIFTEHADYIQSILYNNRDFKGNPLDVFNNPIEKFFNKRLNEEDILEILQLYYTSEQSPLIPNEEISEELERIGVNDQIVHPFSAGLTIEAVHMMNEFGNKLLSKEIDQMSINNRFHQLINTFFTEIQETPDKFHMLGSSVADSKSLPYFRMSMESDIFIVKDKVYMISKKAKKQIYHGIALEFARKRQEQLISFGKWDNFYKWINGELDIGVTKEQVLGKEISKVSRKIIDKEMLKKAYDPNIGFNERLEIKKNITEVLGKLPLDSRMFNAFAHLGMQEGVDYRIFEEKDKNGVNRKRIGLGRDTTMNDYNQKSKNNFNHGEDVYIFENYVELQKILKKSSKDLTAKYSSKEVTDVIDRMFGERFKKFGIELRRNMSMDQLPKDFDLEAQFEKADYVSEKGINEKNAVIRVDKEGTYYINEFFQALYYLQHLTSVGTDSFIAPKKNAVDGAMKFSKVTKHNVSSGSQGALNTPNGIEAISNVIDLVDIDMNLDELGTKIGRKLKLKEAADGVVLVSHMAHKRMENSFGFIYGENDNRMKLVVSSINPFDQTGQIVKGSQMRLTQEESEASDFAVKFERKMLDVRPEQLGLNSTDTIKVKGNFTKYFDSSDYNTLKEMYDELRGKDYEHIPALELINNFITDRIQNGVDYRNRYIASLNFASTLKGGSNKMNHAKLFSGENYSSEYEAMPDFFSDDFIPALNKQNNEGLYSQQNLNKDVENLSNDSKYAKQLETLFGLPSYVQWEEEMQLENEKGEIETVKLFKREEINKNENAERTQKLENIHALYTAYEIDKLFGNEMSVREMARLNNASMGKANFVTDLLVAGVNVNHHLIMAEYKNFIGGKINSAIEGRKLFGNKYEQSPGMFVDKSLRIYRFLDDAGNEISRETIEGRNAITTIAPVEVIKGYSQAKKMNIKRGESLASVLTITTGNKVFNLKEKIISEYGESVWVTESKRNKAIDKIFEELTLDKIFGSRIHETEGGTLINDKVAKELANYYKVFTGSLFGVLVRTPTPNVSSAARYEIKEFTWDTGNKLGLPPELCSIDNSDYDGDTRAVYEYAITRTKNKDGSYSYSTEIDQDYISGKKDTTDVSNYNNYSNTILSLYEGYFQDTNNSESMVDILSTDRIKRTMEKETKNKNFVKLHNDLTTTLKNIDSAHFSNRMIGSLANSLTTVARIMKSMSLDPSLRDKIELKMQFVLNGSENSIDNIAESLQAALDGIKQDILSDFNLTLKSQNIFVAMLADGVTLSNAINTFANNELLKSANRHMERNDNVGSWESNSFLEALTVAKENQITYARNNIKESPEKEAKLEKIKQELNEDFERFYDYYLKGQALRRLSTIYSIYSGKKVSDYENYKLKENFEFILGNTLSEFIEKRHSGGKLVLNKEIQEKRFRDLKETEKEKALEEDEKIREKVDVAAFVRANNMISTMVEAINAERIINARHDLRESEVIQNAIDNIFKKQNITFLDSKTYYETKLGVEGFLIDTFYKSFNNGEKRINFDFTNIESFMGMPDFDLSDRHQADRFVVVFTEYIRTLKSGNLTDNTSVSEILNSEFLKGIFIDEKVGKLKLESGNSANPTELLNVLKKSYSEINNKEFKKAFEHYAFLTYGLENNRYSLMQLFNQGASNIVFDYADYLEIVKKQLQEEKGVVYEAVKNNLEDNLILAKRRYLVKREKGKNSKKVSGEYYYKTDSTGKTDYTYVAQIIDGKEVLFQVNVSEKTVRIPSNKTETKKLENVGNSLKVDAYVLRPSDSDAMMSIHRGEKKVTLVMNKIEQFTSSPNRNILINGIPYKYSSRTILSNNRFKVIFKRSDETGYINNQESNKQSKLNMELKDGVKRIFNEDILGENVKIIPEHNALDFIRIDNKNGKKVVKLNINKLNNDITLSNFQSLLELKLKEGEDINYVDFIKKTLKINTDVFKSGNIEITIDQVINKLFDTTLENVKFTDLLEVKNTFNKIMSRNNTFEEIINSLTTNREASSNIIREFKEKEKIELSDENIGFLESEKETIEAINKLSIGNKISNIVGEAQSVEFATNIMEKLKSKFGVDYSIISEAEAKKMGVTDARGFFMNNKVYLVKEKMSLDTPFHEVLHPIIKQIEQSNKKLYRSLVQSMNELIANDNRVADIASQIDRKYSNRNENDIINEKLVTIISGLTAGKIKIEYKNSFKDNVKAFFKHLWNLITGKGRVYSNVREMPSNLRIKDMVDLMLDDTVLNLKGNNISLVNTNTPVKPRVSKLFESNPELANEKFILESNNSPIELSRDDIGFDTSEKRYSSKVESNGLSSLILDNDDNISNEKFLQQRQKQKHINKIFGNMKIGKDLGVVKINGKENSLLKNKFLKYYNEKNEKLRKKYEKELKDDIEKHLVPIYLKSNETIQEGIINIINDFNSIDDISDELLENYLGKEGAKSIKKEAIISMIKRLEIGRKTKIMKYSDFKTKFPELYDSRYDFDELYVLVHNAEKKDGRDVMNVTLTTFDLNNNYKQKVVGRKDSNILGKFINDKEAWRKGLDGYTANYGNVIKLQMALLNMKISTINPDFNVRNMSLTSIFSHNENVNITTVDMGSSIRNLQKMSMVKDFTDSLNDDIVETMTNSEMLDRNKWATDYIDIMRGSLMDKIDQLREEGRDTSILEFHLEKIEEFKIGELDPSNLIPILKDRKEWLERLNNINAKNNETSIIDQIDDEYRSILEFIRIYEGRSEIKQYELKDYKDSSAIHYALKNVRDVKNPILQNYFTNMLDASHQAAGLIRQELENEVNPIVDEMKKIQKEQGRHWKGKGVLLDQGESFWNRLFMKEKIKNESGEIITVNAKRIHHDMNDIRTIEAIRNGQLSEEEVKVGKKIVDFIEKKVKGYYRHNLISINSNRRSQFKKYDKKKKTYYIDEVELKKAVDEMYETNWDRGLIPLFRKDGNEYVRKGKIWDGIKTFGRRKADFKYDMDDVRDMEDMFSDTAVKSMFYKQLTDSNDHQYGGELRSSMLGIQNISNEMILTDKVDANQGLGESLFKTAKRDRFTDNLETVMRMFSADQIWQREMENNALPVYNDTKLRLKIIESKEHMKQNMNTKMVEEYFNTLVNGISSDTDKGLIGAMNASMSVLSRLVIWSGTAVKPSIGVVAFSANTIEEIAHFVGSTIAKTRDSLKGKKVTKALIESTTDLNKYDRLGKMFNVVEQSKFDLMGQQRYYQTKNSVFNNRTSGFFAWLGDMATRYQMIGLMMEVDGTREAYQYDKEIKDVIFNAKKDKRFFDENGKQTKEQKAYMESLIQDLLEDPRWQDQQKAEIEEAERKGRQPMPVQAYSFRDERRIKSFISSKVIGSYLQEESPVASNRMLWKFISVFRRFMYSKIEQRLGGTERLFKEEDIFTYKPEESYKVILFDEKGDPIRDKNGKIAYEWQTPKEEGFWLTPIKQIMSIIKKAKDGRLYDIHGWNQLEEHQKYNFVRLGFDMVLLVAAIALRHGVLRDDDDEYKGKKGLLEKNPYLRAFKNGIFTTFEAAPWRILEAPFTPAPWDYLKRLIKVVRFRGSKYDNQGVIPGYSGGKQMVETLDGAIDLVSYSDLEN